DGIAVASPHLVARLADFRRGELLHGSRSQPRTRLQLDRDERGAIAQRARVVLVARRLVDARFRAERRLDRVEAHAVGLPDAIAAAFTDALVDNEPADGLLLF